MRAAFFAILVLLILGVVISISSAAGLTWLWGIIIWLVVAIAGFAYWSHKMREMYGHEEAPAGAKASLFGMAIAVPSLLTWLVFEPEHRGVSFLASVLALLISVALIFYSRKARVKHFDHSAGASWSHVVDLRSPEVAKMERDGHSPLGRRDEALAQELKTLLARTTFRGGTVYDDAYYRIRAIGDELNRTGGISQMQKVAYRVVALGGLGRVLEQAWNRIGEWEE